MVSDASGSRFEPAGITVKAGDGIKFIVISGGPHNVAFDVSAIPDDAKPQLSTNMPNQQGNLSSPLLMNANESYVISFASVKPGRYCHYCAVHRDVNMRGTITVE